ncbi:MAG: sigma-70 family RNA polymerase sigma factor [Spirochaetota bacterium]
MNKRDKFTEVYNKYYPLVFSTVHTKVENIDDATDITQEVFISFYEKFSEIIDHRKWLYGALRFAVLNFYKKRRDNVNIDDIFNDVSLTFVNGFRHARVIISDAIEKGEVFDDDTDRTLFDLVAVYTYSYTEAGQELGLTKRQVEYKYRRIVDKILDYLKKNGIDRLEDIL